MKNRFYYEIILNKKVLMATESRLEATLICRYISLIRGREVSLAKYRHSDATRTIFINDGVKGSFFRSIKLINKKLMEV